MSTCLKDTLLSILTIYSNLLATFQTSRGGVTWDDKHKRIWSQNLVGAVAFHALMTSLCPNGFNTHKTKQRKLLF